jgi:hypothetical protein
MFSLTVMRTDEIDGIFPLPANRAPGLHPWFMSRVELAPADGGAVTEWQKYHPNGESVGRDFSKFGSTTKISRITGANGTWGSKVRTIRRKDDQKRDVWSLLREFKIRRPACGRKSSSSGNN